MKTTEYWKTEIEFLRNQNCVYVGKSFNYDPACYARYLDMQANRAIKEGELVIASEIQEIWQRTVFLDYVNNYLTVEKFADDYGFDIDYANEIIEKGRENQ